MPLQLVGDAGLVADTRRRPTHLQVCRRVEGGPSLRLYLEFGNEGSFFYSEDLRVKRLTHHRVAVRLMGQHGDGLLKSENRALLHKAECVALKLGINFLGATFRSGARRYSLFGGLLSLLKVFDHLAWLFEHHLLFDELNAPFDSEPAIHHQVDVHGWCTLREQGAAAVDG